jgi:hypothetical protein
MNTNMTPTIDEERPWWFVRVGLTFTLAMLVAILVVVLIQPELLDRFVLANL